jgi:hypothetical protein
MIDDATEHNGHPQVFFSIGHKASMPCGCNRAPFEVYSLSDKYMRNAATLGDFINAEV